MIIRRDETFRVVFNLRTPKGGAEVIGTGIFVAKDQAAFLVTATHVARGCNANTKLLISDATGNSTELLLSAFNKGLAWKHHTVGDISVMPIIIDGVVGPHLDRRCFPYDHFHFAKTCVSRDDQLTAVGFPNGLGSKGKFNPLTYRSYASSAFISLNRADTNTESDFFLLENPSIGGYSGCPVFDLGYMIVGAMTTTKEKTVCYGIMHGTLSDNTGGKLAAVTPAFYLADLL